MCGIAGILRIHPPGAAPPRPLDSIPESWLDILDDSIKHRGPDGRGRFRQRTTRPDGATLDIALVHRRLSIIDHAGGTQPMLIGSPQSPRTRSASKRDDPHTPGASDFLRDSHPADLVSAHPALLSLEGSPYTPPASPHICPACSTNSPGTLAVVFNGCIYNHRELRRELESAGHVFHTDHSDTEVLLHGWSEWSSDLTTRLDGMYAFSLWNAEAGELTYARDFAGEKPLYAGHRADLGMRYFASNPAGAVKLNTLWGPPPRLDEEGEISNWHTHAKHHVRLWLDGADWEMPYPDTDEVPPYSVFVRGSGGGDWIERRERGYTRPKASPVLDVDHLDEALAEAVESRLESDVPLGCFLSGGVDSSLVARYARDASGSLRTFCVRMPDARYDESVFAARVAAHLGTDHTTLECESRPAHDLVHLIDQLGLPFADSSLLPAYWLCKEAARHVRVALCGDGADELFGGYERYIAKRKARPIQHLIGMIPVSLLPDRHPKSRTSKLRRLVRACRVGDLRRAGLGAIWDDADEARLTGRVLPLAAHVPFVGAIQNASRWWEQRGNRRLGLLEVDDMISDFLHYLPEDLLRKTDTASMAVALEVRAPFLAKELALAALSEPLSSLMPHGQRKGLLRAVARKYLPADIVDRPKMGFAIPISDWFRTDYGGMRQLLLDHLSAADPFPGLAESGINLNMAFVRQMLKEHDDAGVASLWPWKGRDHGQRLYMLLVLSIWCHWLQRIRRGE